MQAGRHEGAQGEGHCGTGSGSGITIGGGDGGERTEGNRGNSV